MRGLFPENFTHPVYNSILQSYVRLFKVFVCSRQDWTNEWKRNSLFETWKRQSCEWAGVNEVLRDAVYVPAPCLHFFFCEFWSLSVMSYKLGEYSVWSGMRMKRIGVFQCTSLFRKLQSELSMKTSATFSSKTSTAVIAIRTSYKTSWGSTTQSLWKQTSFSLVGNESRTVFFSIELTQKTYFRNAGQDGLGIPLLPIFCDYDVVLSSVSLVSRHPFSYFLFVCLFVQVKKIFHLQVKPLLFPDVPFIYLF